jgi:hypothetical protein
MSFDPDVTWNNFEQPFEAYWSSEKTGTLLQLMDYFRSRRADAKLEDMKKELNILNRIAIFTPNRIADVWRWCGDNICQPFPEWREQDADYYQKRMNESTNMLHKARYAYAAWSLKKGDIKEAQMAVDGFLKAAEEYSKRKPDPELDETMVMCFRLSFRLALAINRASPVDAKKVLAEMSSVVKTQHSLNVETFAVGRLIDLISESSKSLIQMKQYRTDEEVKRVVLETAGTADEIASKAEEKSNYEAQQIFLQKEVSLLSNLGEDGDARKARIAVAESLEKRAESVKGRSILHSIHLQSAVRIYAELGVTNKVKELTAEIQQDAKKAVDNKEFKAVSVPVEIPVDEIIGYYLQSLIGLTAEEVLTKIVADDYLFIPDVQFVRKQEIELKGEFPLQYTLSRVEYDQNLPSRTIKDEGKMLEASVNRHFLLDAQVRLTILSRMLSLLIPERIQKEDIVSFLSDGKNFGKEDLKLVSRAFDRYNDSDYVTFCHIIVPRIEQGLRSILDSKGGKTASFDPKDVGFDLKLMGGLILDLKPYLSQDLHKYLEVWYSQEGFNLRNKISHGWMKLSEFDKRLADLLIYTMIRLSAV